VISYRRDGRPGIEDIAGLLRASGRAQPVILERPYQYALSPKASVEILLISER
jgi:hypothetical protein